MGSPCDNLVILSAAKDLLLVTPATLEHQLAPDFTAPTDADVQLRLSSLRGRVVVLYFYPKDDTPG